MTKALPRHEQEWTVEPHCGVMTALSEDTLNVLDHDVLTLENMGFLHATSRNYLTGNRYVLTPMAYEHVEIIRDSDAAQTEPTGWAAVDQATGRLRSRFSRAHDAGDFKAVGLLCVSVLEDLGRAAFDPTKHLPEGAVEPHANDAKARLDYFIQAVAPGDRFEHVRRIVRASWDQAQSVKHRDQPNRTDAGIGVDAVILLTRIIRRLADEQAGSAD